MTPGRVGSPTAAMGGGEKRMTDHPSPSEFPADNESGSDGLDAIRGTVLGLLFVAPIWIVLITVLMWLA